ncbi:MAG TPA: aldo/keto reductase [bacterium]|nr:aldo/keto reductase [bacterium]
MGFLDKIEMGVGTWAWGDGAVWGFGKGYGAGDLKEVFDLNLAAGVTFFDTAEVYGDGKSESYLGGFLKTVPDKAVHTATKFMPFPWRVSTSHLLKSLRASLKRLDLPRVDLYQVHFPMPFRSIEAWMEPLAEAVKEGLAAEVGVSNYSRSQMLRARDALGRRGVPLASNQVQLSLARRKNEFNGVLETCRAEGIRLIAFSPLGMGMLSGKYGPKNPPRGPRRIFYFGQLGRVEKLVGLLREIGRAQGGKSPNQVALNWLIGKGALPIPGAKTAAQARENLGALGWRLSPDQMARLDEASRAFTL